MDLLKGRSNKSITPKSKSKTRTKTPKSKSKKPKGKSLKPKKKKKVTRKGAKNATKLPVKKKKTKKRTSIKIVVTKEKKVVRRKNRKKKISKVNNLIGEEPIEQMGVELELEGRGSIQETQVESMPMETRAIAGRGSNEGGLDGKAGEMGRMIRIETQEMLDEVNRSDSGIKMKHKSFTKLGNRNLSFEGGNKLLMHNFQNAMNLPEINEDSIQKENPPLSPNPPEQPLQETPTKNNIEVIEEVNTFNRVLADSMNQLHDAQKETKENPKKNAIEPEEHHDSNRMTLSKAEDSQLEKKLITQENSFAQTADDGPTVRDKTKSKDSRKIVNRSFKQTMKSIYDGVDRTLNIIEITENTEGESNDDPNKVKPEFKELEVMPELNKKERLSLDLNETIKEKKGRSKREIFFEKMGVPLETMMTAPAVPSKRFDETGPLRTLDNESTHKDLKISPSKTQGQEILKRYSKMSHSRNMPQRLSGLEPENEANSTSGMPINRRFSQNDRRVVLSRQNLPLTSRIQARLNKEQRSPKMQKFARSPNRVMTRSVDNFPMGPGRPKQMYQRWNPSVTRMHSPQMYSMQHGLDQMETLSMPGNVVFLQKKHTRPMSSIIGGPSTRSNFPMHGHVSPPPRMNQRPLHRQVSENFLHSRGPMPRNMMGFSNVSNHVPPRISGNYNPRPQSSQLGRVSPPPQRQMLVRGMPGIQSVPQFQNFSREDMENRLVMLIKKVLVYSSKIESIKKKIIRQNPGFTSLKMFQEFSDNQNSINLEGLFQLFQAFGFHPPAISIYKIMIYLSNYQLESVQTPMISDPNNPRKGYTITPEGRLASIRKVNPGRFDDPVMNPPQLFGAHSGMPAPQNQVKSISLAEFRTLFESKSIISNRENHPSSHEDVKIKEIDFHLIRQIFMLIARMLDDLSKIIRTLQPYGTMQIFGYLLEFNHLPKDSTIIDHSNTSKLLHPQDSIDNAIGISEGNLKNQAMHPEYSPIKKTVKNFGGKDRRGYDFTKKKNLNGDVDLEEADDEDGEDFRIEGQVHRGGQSGQKFNGKDDARVVGLETMSTFLEFHKAHFIPDDLHLILGAFGVSEGGMALQQFDHFLSSPLWNL